MKKINTEIIRIQIAKKNISNKEIAEKLGVHRNQISKWRNGEIADNINDFINFCNLLEINTDELKKDS